eukprot:3417439-Amphidinium_carterae.2
MSMFSITLAASAQLIFFGMLCKARLKPRDMKHLLGQDGEVGAAFGAAATVTDHQGGQHVIGGCEQTKRKSTQHGYLYSILVATTDHDVAGQVWERGHALVAPGPGYEQMCKHSYSE